MDKVIVITGSTQGIGYGLALEFLNRGCKVLINGRTNEKVQSAKISLQENAGNNNVIGFAADITNINAVKDLWQSAVGSFGKVDIWINNAGINHSTKEFYELSAKEIEQVINTNILGAIFGSKIAIEGMLDQGFGFIYNMEGMGSNGMTIFGQSMYSTSKAALTHFTKSIVEEQNHSPVKIGYIRPGMVLTDMLVKDDINEYRDYERFKKVTNILADRVETVAPFIVDAILKDPEHGIRINWLSRSKVFWRFLTAPFNKRDFFTN